MGVQIGKTKALCCWALLLTAYGVSTVGAADLYVQAARTDLRGAPTLAAEKLATALRGESLTRLEESGGWYRVGHQERLGWVPRLMVGPQPPGTPLSVLDDAAEDLGVEARRRASQFTSAAAARGLTSRTRANDRSRPNHQALRQMETLQIDEAEALRFLAERGR